MPKQLPFKISARTARLIGRQNFPNSEGAIIELVKNCYDADASKCIVIFDDRYLTIPNNLIEDDFQIFSKENEYIKKYYIRKSPNDIHYTFINDSINEEIYYAIESFFASKCKLIIIDDGIGMTDEIIENFWMTIGTDNKESEIYTPNGRVKTGAKGIGRFALDKLGDIAIMHTKPNPDEYPKHNSLGFKWIVNWKDFEGDSKVLNQVEADLITIDNFEYDRIVSKLIESHIASSAKSLRRGFTHGTMIEIEALRDSWDKNAIGKLFSNLEVLIPPREDKRFEIYLFSLSYPDLFGKVSPTICDDFDYKLSAKINNNGMAKIWIERNEFDLSQIPEDFFKRPSVQKLSKSPTDFRKDSIFIKKTLSQLVPGLGSIDQKHTLEKIGPFEFILYFMKNKASKEEQKKFLYKDFNAAYRKKWFSQFGGIKIFRDGFRVRPYGETNSRSFDWLSLGDRSSRSPQSIGQHRSGNWTVRPTQVSGIVNISRITNIDFEDTSSRSGLQENTTFEYFIQILIGIIREFEKDRTNIGRELSEYYREKTNTVSENEVRKAKAELKKKNNIDREVTYNDHNKLVIYAQTLEESSDTIADYAEQLEEQIEEMRSESNLLRILASNALVISSFSHELQNIKTNLVIRLTRISDCLNNITDKSKLQNLPDYLNPFILIEDAKNDDEKLKQWLQYSLETLKKDKRRRKKNDLIQYFVNFKNYWDFACKSRGVELNVDTSYHNEIRFRFFEADLDSIFNNLLVNSFEAFLRSNAPTTRNINILINTSNTDIFILYQDSGPGLDHSITDPDSIFEPHETTKRDAHTGEEIGTGLGMWLVKSIVEDNNGEVELMKTKKGFGIKIVLKNKIGG